MLNKFLAALSFCVFITSKFHAQERDKVADSTVLETILLKSSALENTALQTPAAVNVIEETSLKSGNTQLLTEKFNTYPGIFVQTGALNTSKISIRGIGSRAQYGTNRIKVYFNEIPITTADGQSVLNDFDLNAIQKVEIVKGPNASLYAAGLGGLVQLQSKIPTANFTEVKTAIGSFGMRKNIVQAGFTEENKNGIIAYTNLDNDGFRENSEYNRSSFFANLNVLTKNKNKLSFVGNFTRLKAFIPSSLSRAALEENPKQAAYTWKKAKGYEAYDRFLMGVSYTHHFSEKIKNTSSVFTNWRDAYEPRPFDILKEKRWGLGARTRFNYKDSLAGFPTKISLGAEALYEDYDQENFENLYEDFPDVGSVRGGLINNLNQERAYWNLFGQAEIRLSEKWKLSAGLNFNSTQYQLSDFYNQDENNQNGSYAFKNIWSPRVATAYFITSHKTLYANISKGFSVPTFSESLTPEGKINTSLKPEIGWNYEIGFKGTWFSKLYTEINLYSIQVSNLLVAQRVAEDRYVGVNAGKTEHTGVEWIFSYTWNFGENLKLKPIFTGNFNHYRFAEFVNKDQNYDGNKLTGVPKLKWNLGASLSWEKLRLHANYLAVSKIPVNDANSVYTNAYEILDLKACYLLPIFQNFEMQLSAGIDNLLDTNYSASFVPNAVGFGNSEPRYFYPGMPRNFYAGISLKYLW